MEKMRQLIEDKMEGGALNLEELEGEGRRRERERRAIN